MKISEIFSKVIRSIDERNRIPNIQVQQYLHPTHMQTALYVPMQVNALILDDPQNRSSRAELSIAEAMADFSQLPTNADQPHIAESLVSKPFGHNQTLGSGVHLHWALPEVFTKGIEVKDAVTGNQKLNFLATPNRWLVVKVRSNNIYAVWIVESDYIHTPNMPLPDKNEITLGPTYLATWPSSNSQYVKLGRSILLKEYSGASFINTDLLEKGEYLINKPGHELTAIGYGNPHFASFYPNCMSIFGMKEFTNRQANDEFHIFGWYSNPEKDVLRKFVEDLPETTQIYNFWNYSVGGYTDYSILPEWTEYKEKVYQKIREKFSWNVVDSDVTQIDVWGAGHVDKPRLIPTSTICYGHVKVTTTDTPVENYSKAVRAALGNSVEQATAVHNATNGEESTIRTIEKEQFADAVKGRILDVDSKQAEAHHNVTFRPYNAGILWHIVSRTMNPKIADSNDSAAHHEITLPSELADLINRLNANQSTCNTLKHELKSLRNQLFQDWYNYNREKKFGNPTSIPKSKWLEFIHSADVPNLHQKIAALTTAERVRDVAKQLLKEALNQYNNAQANTSVQFILETFAAPRYYQPTNPAIVLGEPISKRHPARVNATTLNCFSEHYYKLITVSPQNSITSVNLLDLINIHFSSSPDDYVIYMENNGFNAHNITRGEKRIPMYTELSKPWNPLLMDWEIEYRANSSKFSDISHRTYDPNFVNTHFVLSDGKVDYIRNSSGPADSWVRIIQGRSMLIPHTKDGNLIIFTLQGFRENLLGYKSEMQLNAGVLNKSFHDPLLADIEPFIQTNKEIYQVPLSNAEMPISDFMPISSGTLKVHKFRLVDSFGFTTHLENNILIASYAKEVGTLDQLYMAPRINQPARINFRWIAANSDIEEVNSHPATTPICGWILPNLSQNRLVVLEADGTPLGTIHADGSWKAEINMSESTIVNSNLGKMSRYLTATPIDNIKNPHLKKMVRYLISKTTSFRADLLNVTMSALKNIEPENFSQHISIANILSTPLAVVRAHIDLELMGIPEFRTNLSTNGQRVEVTKQFEKVQFPIRIGEYQQLNDGLVGYWVENPDGTLPDTFHAPQDDSSVQLTSGQIRTHTTGNCFVTQAIDSPKTTLLMLMDVRGSVHATSGILPTKNITIPPDQYKEALKNIHMYVPVRPLIMPENKLAIDLPVDADYQFEWLEKVGDVWNAIPINQIAAKEEFKQRFGEKNSEVIWGELLEQGWIQPINSNTNTPTDKGLIVPPSDRKSNSLSANLKPFEKDIERLLEHGHITQSQPDFSSSNVIHEGWLGLHPK